MSVETVESPLPQGLVDARAQVFDEVKRADTKAAMLLTLVGGALAGVITLSSRTMPGVSAVLLWVSMLPIAVAVAVLLAAIRPRLRTTPAPGTWLHAAGVDAETLLAVYGPADVVATASDVCAVARITRAKFRWINQAVVLLGCGLALLATSLLVTAVTSGLAGVAS